MCRFIRSSDTESCHSDEERPWGSMFVDFKIPMIHRHPLCQAHLIDYVQLLDSNDYSWTPPTPHWDHPRLSDPKNTEKPGMTPHTIDFESGIRFGYPLIRKGTDTMMTVPATKVPVETIDWTQCFPTYPFRFKGTGFIYCVGCQNFIRLVGCRESGLLCSDCHRVLASIGK